MSNSCAAVIQEQELRVVANEDKGEDIRVTRLEEIYNLLRGYTRAHFMEIRDLSIDPEDFVQDVVMNIFRRKGLDVYVSSKCKSFESLIFRIARNYLIDKKRAFFNAKSRQGLDGNPIRVVSLNESLTKDGEESFTLMDVISASPDIVSLMGEIEAQISEDLISPNYDLTWKKLWKLSIVEGAREIGSQIGISSSRVTQLQRQLCDKIREYLGLK